jgi:hypothetical protein
MATEHIIESSVSIGYFLTARNHALNKPTITPFAMTRASSTVCPKISSREAMAQLRYMSHLLSFCEESYDEDFVLST